MLNIPSVLLLIGSYLLGSIPFGILFAKLLRGKNIKKHGSGNIGATNALRVGGKSIGTLTLLADILKGFIAVITTKNFDANLAIWSMNLVILGHISPIWLRFQGGKGVATFIGSMLALTPYLGITVIAIYLTVFAFKKISSLSTITSLFSGVLISMFYTSTILSINFLIIYLIILWRHTENIKRLVAGKEKPINLH